MQTIVHKKGDTLVINCTYLDKLGIPADYTALSITISSQVRKSTGQLIANLAVTPGAGTGEFVLRANTSAWPLGSLCWDIQFTVGSEIFSTQTASIEMLADITHP